MALVAASMSCVGTSCSKEAKKARPLIKIRKSLTRDFDNSRLSRAGRIPAHLFLAPSDLAVLTELTPQPGRSKSTSGSRLATYAGDVSERSPRLPFGARSPAVTAGFSWRAQVVRGFRSSLQSFHRRGIHSDLRRLPVRSSARESVWPTRRRSIQTR